MTRSTCYTLLSLVKNIDVIAVDVLLLQNNQRTHRIVVNSGNGDHCSTPVHYTGGLKVCIE